MICIAYWAMEVAFLLFNWNILKVVETLRDIGEKVHYLLLTLNELTCQEFNELHPLPNEVIILHEHLSYWLVWQYIDKVTNYWPIAVVLECTTLTIHHSMIWNCVWKQVNNNQSNQAWLKQSTVQTCTIYNVI